MIALRNLIATALIISSMASTIFAGGRRTARMGKSYSTRHSSQGRCQKNVLQANKATMAEVVQVDQNDLSIVLALKVESNGDAKFLSDEIIVWLSEYYNGQFGANEKEQIEQLITEFFLKPEIARAKDELIAKLMIIFSQKEISG